MEPRESVFAQAGQLAPFARDICQLQPGGVGKARTTTANSPSRTSNWASASEQAAWPFDDLEPFDNRAGCRNGSEPPSRGSALIMWARAVWDGKNVDVDCRCEAAGELAGQINCAGESDPITNWTVVLTAAVRSTQVPWADAKRPPLLVQLTCEQRRERAGL